MAATGDLGFGARFGLAVLATWRLSHLLAEEDGPADLVVLLRERLGEGGLADLMDCFYCLSIWISMPLSLKLTGRRRDGPMVWLAVSGAACLIERVTADATTLIANPDSEGAANVLRP